LSGAQLKKAQGQLYLYLNKHKYISTCTLIRLLMLRTTALSAARRTKQFVVKYC